MRILSAVGFILVGIGLGFVISRYIPTNHGLISPLAPNPTPKPLLKYTFDNLSHYVPQASHIQLKSVMFTDPKITAYLATFTTGGKVMSMQIMVPDTATPSAGFPVILMVRGFVDTGMYQTGIGTKPAASYFAKHGFVTVAPDFLGYGISDPPAADTMAARFERPPELIDLIASLPSLSFVDPSKMGLWGHSNGGQISLSVLEITGKPIPTVLWAPVSKPFPYSILYYTDESDDGGKALRQVLANFEKDYNTDDYSLAKYINRITAPIELHQGTADPEVPLAWSDALVKTLKGLKVDVTYYTYPGADHNLQPGWQTVVDRSLAFFQKQLK